MPNGGKERETKGKKTVEETRENGEGDRETERKGGKKRWKRSEKSQKKEKGQLDSQHRDQKKGRMKSKEREMRRGGVRPRP